MSILVKMVLTMCCVQDKVEEGRRGDLCEWFDLPMLPLILWRIQCLLWQRIELLPRVLRGWNVRLSTLNDVTCVKAGQSRVSCCQLSWDTNLPFVLLPFCLRFFFSVRPPTSNFCYSPLSARVCQPLIEKWRHHTRSNNARRVDGPEIAIPSADWWLVAHHLIKTRFS